MISLEYNILLLDFIPYDICTMYIPEEMLDNINTLVEAGNYDEAIWAVNQLLARDPKNEDALLMVADVLYRQWNIDGADKAVDFLNYTKKDDPLGLYIKWLLEMEKNNRKEACSYLRKAMKLTNNENYEIVRCYGLSEYRYWNREKWRDLLKQAFKHNSMDAEVIYNIIQLAILDWDYEESKEMTNYYYENRTNLKTVDKPIEWYDKKIALFDKFTKWKERFNLNIW